MYFLFERGSRFRRQADWSCNGQQHSDAAGGGFANGRFETVEEPSRNLIEPETKFGRVTVRRATPFEGCRVDGNLFRWAQGAAAFLRLSSVGAHNRSDFIAWNSAPLSGGADACG